MLFRLGNTLFDATPSNPLPHPLSPPPTPFCVIQVWLLSNTILHLQEVKPTFSLERQGSGQHYKRACEEDIQEQF